MPVPVSSSESSNVVMPSPCTSRPELDGTSGAKEDAGPSRPRPYHAKSVATYQQSGTLADGRRGCPQPHLVQLPVGVDLQSLAACSDALDLRDEETVAMRKPGIADQALVLLVLRQQLVEVLLVGHARRLVLRHVFDAL